MTKQTIELTNEKFAEIYTDEQFRNQVAFSHWQCNSRGEKLHRITCSYPTTWIVTDEQREAAEVERLRAKKEAIASIGTKLVFVGMGMTYDLTETDDIGNHRIRTEFYNRHGNRFFIEFGKSRNPEFLRIDHAINRTKQDLYNDSVNKQSEFHNYKDLERNTPKFRYTKADILKLINHYFDCNFTEMEIDNYNLRTEDFVCVSPNNLQLAEVK